MERNHPHRRASTWFLDPDIHFRRNWLLHGIIAVYILFWYSMALAPTSRIQWWAENTLLIGLLLLLILTYKRFPLSNTSYLLVFLFLCLHTYAAHFAYQDTPFDQWMKAVFHTKRSYFDRVVHLAFGLFGAYPIRELLVRIPGLRGFWSYAVPAAIVLSFSAFYEILEMAGALIAGQAGKEFLGLQGDIFDTQKDMGWGVIGAVLSMIVLAWIIWKRKARMAT